MDVSFFGWISTVGVPAAYVLGVLSAIDAVLHTRTPQGAAAWALALVMLPFVALPLYWVFGRSQFQDYVQALRDFDDQVHDELAIVRQDVLAPWSIAPSDEADVRTRSELHGFETLSTLSFTHGNGLHLLIDGDATFEAIFAGIDRAEDYVLAQFYIIHDDDLGTIFQQKLIDAAERGVRVYLLYDEVGCHDLPRRYLRRLREAGVDVSGFSGERNWLGRFRLNFRNHRKVVVVDGEDAYMGGLNVGDEYMGHHERLTPWRDTHLAVQGPVVLGLQFSFLRDWYYGRQDLPEVRWTVTPSERDQQALVLASGPADELETCGLLFTHAIESAERRIWITSPYFVPDGRVLGALQMAALRGVDVRVLMPRTVDYFLFKYVPYAYLPEAERAGVKVYLYEEGFLHEKVLLVDDDYAAVGTANLDNRSFRFNFEVTCLARDATFCADVEAMLERDFARATQLTGDDLEERSFAFRLATQTTRLLAPVL